MLSLLDNSVIWARSSISNTEAADEELYPFKKANNKISDEEVVGIRITRDKIVLLDDEMNFYAESIKEEDSNFSEFNYFSKYPNLMSVDLSELDLDQNKLENLQKYLPMKLKSIVINSCDVKSADYESLVDIVTQRKDLVSVCIIEPNAVAGDVAKVIVALSELNKLQYLNLTLGGLDEVGCKNLVKVTENNTKTLHELTLGFIKIDESESYDQLMKSLGKLKTLTKLEFTVLESNDEQEGSFYGSLSDMQKLQDLKINFGDMSTHDDVKTYHNALKLKESLLKLTDIRSLDISDMHLQDSVLQLVMQSISQLGNLKVLNISGNDIDAKTAKILSQSIKSGQSLVTLMANNCGIGAEAFKELCSSIDGTQIRYLYLGNNSIGTAISSLPVDKMDYITAIDFTSNDIDYDSFSEFIKKLNENTPLRVVIVRHNEPMEKLEYAERVKKTDGISELKLNNKIYRLAIFGI